jgi:hypothetical protein
LNLINDRSLVNNRCLCFEIFFSFLFSTLQKRFVK